jgi:hypothetical protein
MRNSPAVYRAHGTGSVIELLAKNAGIIVVVLKSIKEFWYKKDRSSWNNAKFESLLIFLITR